MVGVAVSVEDGVDVANVFANRLDVKIGSSVDEDDAVVVVEENGGTRAAIVRVRRSADCAVAAERRDAHGGAGAQKSEGRFHRLADDLRTHIWAGSTWDGPGSFGCRGAGNGLRDFEEGHAKLEEGAIEQIGLFRRKVAFCLFGEDGQHVD